MHNFTWIFLIVFIVLFAIIIIAKQQVAVFVVIFLFSSLGFLLTCHEVRNRDEVYTLEEKQVEIIGNVSRVRETEFGFCVYLQNVKLEGKTLNHTIVYTDNVEGIKIGNAVKVSGSIKQFDTARNYGNFDNRKYYMSLGIYIGVCAKEIFTVNSNYDGIRQNLEQLKNSIKVKMDEVCNHKGKGILKVLNNKNTIYEGILLGDKSDIDIEMKETYALSGIAHILAISGLHISMIGMFIYFVLRRRFCFGVSASFSVTIVVLFGILSGMGIATIRALVMFGLKLLGEVLGRHYDYVTAISLAGIMLLMENPFAIYNSGFQMSFAAILSIVIVWKRITYILQIEEEKKQRQWVKRKFKRSILFSLTISMCMNPIVAYNYFSLSTYAFMINIIVVPLMSIVVASGVIGIASSYIAIRVARITIFPGCLVLELYEKICNFTLKLPYASVIVGKPSLVVVYMYYALIILSLFVLEKSRRRCLKRTDTVEISKDGISMKQYIENKNSRKGKKVFSIILLLLVIILDMMMYCYVPVARQLTEKHMLKVDVIDVGQGDGIVIRTPDSHVITIDGGSTSVENVGKYRMIPYLKSQGIQKIDYAIVTHADEDHINGLLELMKQSDENGVKVKNLVLPDIGLKDVAYNRIIQIADNHQIKILYISQGDHMRFGNVELQCIHPSITTKAEDRNGYSTVLNMKYNKFSMLLTGDISSEQEKILKEAVESDYTILKVAHHGSKYSSSDEFLQRVHFKYSVISVGKHNMYGHPSSETLKRLKQNGSQVLRTDESGEITISTDGEEMRIDTFIK